ncbi:ThyA Thymidylate synthase [uncultured Caudovirales phage]|uniref:thymidylate synthase n=1 Tax=uncultured Caudovirales phage TaxID=2100421 RepID=A0A6J5NS56_9CAUD|nr:ThyA Thymidylate synthase [uncultured Caudovirales phage]
MNQLDRQYKDLLFELITCGVVKETRNGKTVSVFGQQIRHKMSDGFPLLTTKKMYWKGIVTELLWFLRGETNIKYLIDNDCHIWDGDAYKNYLNVVMYERPDYLHEKYGHLNMSVKKDGDKYIPYTQEEFINKIKTDKKFENWADLGPVYGKQWRSWDSYDSIDGETHTNKIDQITNLINDLKTNPDSRRLMVSAWNVGELDLMTLPPCHYGFQVYTRELSNKERTTLYFEKYGYDSVNMEGNDLTGIPTRAISLMWNQRSVDVPLGLPFNIASYGLLLEILAKMTNMVPDELIGNLGDCHIYENQLPGCREQIPREPFALPKLSINDTYWVTSDDAHEYTLDTEILSMLIEDFKIEAYESHPAIKFPLSN